MNVFLKNFSDTNFTTSFNIQRYYFKKSDLKVTKI